MGCSLLISVLLVFFSAVQGQRFGCLNEAGQTVDWWVIYKESKGYRYVYLDSTMSKPIGLNRFKSLTNSSSPLSRTIRSANFSSLKTKTPLRSPVPPVKLGNKPFYIAWNDQPTKGSIPRIGAHAKGFMGIKNTAPNVIESFFIQHSLPRFPNPNGPKNIFDSNLYYRAQHFFCISMKDEFVGQEHEDSLIHPDYLKESNFFKILWNYASVIKVQTFQSSNLEFSALLKPAINALIHDLNENKTKMLSSFLIHSTGVDDEPISIHVTAKSPENHIDIYDDVTSLLSIHHDDYKTPNCERGGHKTGHPSDEKTAMLMITQSHTDPATLGINQKILVDRDDFFAIVHILNSAYVNLPVKGSDVPHHQSSTYQDHSKWSVNVIYGMEGSFPAIMCFYDLNRSSKQTLRGGGAFCLNSSYTGSTRGSTAIWNMFMSFGPKPTDMARFKNTPVEDILSKLDPRNTLSSSPSEIFDTTTPKKTRAKSPRSRVSGNQPATTFAVPIGSESLEEEADADAEAEAAATSSENAVATGTYDFSSERDDIYPFIIEKNYDEKLTPYTVANAQLENEIREIEKRRQLEDNILSNIQMSFLKFFKDNVPGSGKGKQQKVLILHQHASASNSEQFEIVPCPFKYRTDSSKIESSLKVPSLVGITISNFYSLYGQQKLNEHLDKSLKLSIFSTKKSGSPVKDVRSLVQFNSEVKIRSSGYKHSRTGSSLDTSDESSETIISNDDFSGVITSSDDFSGVINSSSEDAFNFSESESEDSNISASAHVRKRSKQEQKNSDGTNNNYRSFVDHYVDSSEHPKETPIKKPRAAGGVTQSTMADSEYFDASVKRITEEILPILQSFPPKVSNDPEGLLAGSIDLLLYRNLLFVLEFCFKETDSRLSVDQLNKLRALTRKQVIPAYLDFFKNNFIMPNGQASSFFYVRQENNATWSKLIWSRIREIFAENEREKSEDSHELGVKVPSGVLDVLARLLEIFFPTEEILISQNPKEKEFSSKITRKFSIRRFELLNFDLRLEAPEVLEAILQRALIERYDPLSAKNAFYILNRIVAFSRETFKFQPSIKDENLFIWSADSKLSQNWEQFIVAYGSVQESQIHLVRPLLPVIKELMREMGSGWWRVLLQRGLCNDSVPIRRLFLHSILTGIQAEDMQVLCSPEGLDFCLEDLLTLGLDANSSFLVAPQHIIEGETGPAMDLGEATSIFFSKIIETFVSKSIGHGKAIIRELLIALEKMVKAPVVLIYILKAFSQVNQFPALEDVDLVLINKIASLIYLHNQRARLLVKRQLTEIMVGFSNAESISFAQLISTLNCLLSESLALGEFTSNSKEFAQISRWLDEIFGADFLKENLSISIGRFYRADGCREKAKMLSVLAVFSLGSGDGRFAQYSRPIFEQLALIKSFDNPREATSAFTLFLTLNETVRTVLRGEGDLLSQIGMNSRIFDWLEFIDGALFGNDLCVKVDFNSAITLLEAFSLLIERASDNELVQFLDIHVFSLINFLQGSTTPLDEDANVDLDVGFKRLLTVLSAMTALASILKKLRAVGHLQPDLITPDSIQKIIRYKLERPGGLSEAEWDQWPEFVTSFTAAKWKCVESISESLVTFKDPKDELLSVLASCLQALEVSKYGGTLAILKCMSTIFDLILGMSDENSDDCQISSLMGLAVQTFKNILSSDSETQRWFDVYAEAFINLFFRSSILKASKNSSPILEYLKDIFEYILTEIGPKRRGIVGLMSCKMGKYWINNTEALSSDWRAQLMQLLLYGPIRGSSDETVAARINHEHVPDSDYQVRVHAASVLNQLKDSTLARDFLVDLLGQQEALSAVKKRMFPGDFGHRLKLRSWAAILLLIGVLCNLPEALEKDFVETDLLQTIWRLVGEEHMSSTRIFMEWALSRLYLKFPSLIIDDFMASRVIYCDVPATLIISMIAIALNMTKKMKSVDETLTMTNFLPQISDFILPLLAHNNHIVRMHAIHAFKQFEREKKLYRMPSDVLGYKMLAGFIETAEHCQKFINKLESEVFISQHGLDPIEDFTIDWIFSRLMRLGGVDGEAIEYYAFMNFSDQVGSVPFNNVNEAISTSNDLNTETKESEVKNITESPIEVTQLFKDFQIKIDIYSPFTMDEIDNAAAGSRPSSPAMLSTTLTDGQNNLETEIIVIGSLLDKLPNLAGLARTSEIFGVRTLYVPDLAALSSPDFVNVAMTADKWLDIRQLAAKDISNFLETIKTEQGFTVVALEQTSNSVPLQSFTFPKKTCIILGNERLGIPAEILHLVDDCVEIPQFGRVRSLNVHVSGSLAIWKAREQDLI